MNRFRPSDQKLKPPALRTVYDRIQDAGPESILQRRPSRLEAHAQQPYGSGPQPTRIMERVEIDISPIHCFIVDDVDRFPIGRPTLTTERDKYSVLPVGLDCGFEPGSYRSVMNCLRHGIQPKVDTRAFYGTKHLWSAFGVPETLEPVEKALVKTTFSVSSQGGLLFEGERIWVVGYLKRVFGS